MADTRTMKAALEQANPAVANRRWRVLLVSANRCTTPEPVFPLGLAHLSSALKEAGHEVSWLDLLTAGDGFQEVLQTNAPELVGISVRNIDDVLIRKQESFVGNLPELVETIHHKLGSSVVLGGSGFSILPRELLEISGADFGVVGEGESSVPALIGALETGADYSGISGLVFRQGSGITVNEPAKPSAEAQPTEADLPPQVVTEYLRRGGVMNVQTQRGCAHRCCYCTYPVIEGTRHRNRSAEAVVSEFERLERLGAAYAFVVDSVFNSSENHVGDICEALVRRGLKIRWGCFLRPQGLTRQMVRLMAQAGLAHVEFGSDSFCDEVLSAYQKDFTFEDIRRSTELIRQEDIDFCHFVIAAGPGETLETMERGFKNSQILGSPTIMAVPGMRIYPGTSLFALAVAEGRLLPGSNLLKPTYYLAPGLSLEQVLETLKGFAAQSPNWVVGDFDADYDGLVARLRQRGVTGPLWSYFATARRLWPRGSAGAGS